MPRLGVLRIAAGVPVEVEEERELHRLATTGAGAVVRAVAGVATPHVRVDGIVAVSVLVDGDGAGGDLFAHLGQNHGGVRAATRRRRVDDVSLMRERAPDLSVKASVLVNRPGVVRTAVMLVPRVEARDFVV